MKITLPGYIKNKKPIILALGCSFTQKDYISQDLSLSEEEKGPWPMWPELLCNKFREATGIDYEVINTGYNGFGLDWSKNLFFENLSKYPGRIEKCFWAGTSWDRFFLPGSNSGVSPMASRINLGYYVTQVPHKPIYINGEKVADIFGQKDRNDAVTASLELYLLSEEKFKSQFANIGIDTYLDHLISHVFQQPGGYERFIHDRLIDIMSVFYACKGQEIEFMYDQILHPWSFILEEKKLRKRFNGSNIVFDTIINLPEYKIIEKNKKHFPMWPWGYPFESWYYPIKDEEEKESMFISKTDRHPNAKGQRHIADKYWNWYVNNSD